MSPGTAKRLVSVVLVLTLGVWSILANDLVKGLDLQGGVTMRYELLPPDDLPPDADVAALVDATIETLNQRIDTYGIRESSMQRQGEREVVIELPGQGKDEAETIKSVISRVGRLEFRLVAFDDLKNGLSVADEQRRLEELLAGQSGRGPDEVDVTPLDRRFPDVLYRWVPYSDRLLAENRQLPPGTERDWSAAPLTAADYLLIRKDTAPARTFTGADVGNAGPGTDQRGGTGVSIALRADRRSDLGDFTGENIGQRMAILLDDRVAQRPATINDRLEGSFIIESNSLGGFSPEEIRSYLTVIRSGSLQMKPRLLYENTIGPSLGESAIKAGTSATIVGLVITIAFMLVYYRWHGVHATTTLVANMVALMGLMMFLGATVTLPGLAGLLLTFGMSVDANILIYERMREEKDRAHSTAQVVKLGFEKALSTIIDSNLTSFITALILYKLGTGPVRGFAVVLMLGLVTSVWATLVLGRAIYDLLVESGRLKTLGSMARFVPPDTNIGFMRMGFTFLRLSGVAVVGSLVVFFATDSTKFGLDFVGGYKAQVRLAQATTQGEVKQRLDAVFPGAQVVSVADPESGDPGRTRQFVIKIKDVAGRAVADDAGFGLEQAFETPVRRSLDGLLLPDLVTDLVLGEDTAAGLTAVSGTLHFETGPGAAAEPERVRSALGLLGSAEVAAAGPDAVTFKGTLPGVGLAPQVVIQRIKTALEDAGGLPRLSEPLVESTTIGGRVGGELRDSAIRALLLSFAAIIVYIKLRFREYSYGIAAVIALLHDVCITLGVVVLARQAGLVDLEIDLTMIAVFLTIIGYSLNDTIVLFDRVRENLPRLNKPLGEVINISMNQVLARTLLTSSTVMLTLLVIFFMNIGQQNLLEGFAFAMIVGVIVGTYSSVFVASPVLLMLTERKAGRTA